MDFGQAFVDGFRAALGVPAAAYALGAIGLNVQYGYTGLLNFGQVGFLLIGAYGTAVSADAGASLLVAVLVGILCSIGLALLLGIPTLRLRADYLAIVTIAASEILRVGVSARQLEGLTGGAFGISGFGDEFFDLNPFSIGRYGIGDFSFDERTLWIASIAWALVALATVGVWLLTRSPYGRLLKSIREDEDAARSLGKNAFSVKLQSLMIGGVLGGLGGIVIAVDASFTNADYWRSQITFFLYVVLILGGVASVLGPVLGSMIFWFVFQASDAILRQAVDNGAFGDVFTTTDVGPIRLGVVGLTLMLLSIFRPQGILGNRAEALVDEQ
jgi:branched-chain amino acid transport system permease protein